MNDEMKNIIVVGGDTVALATACVLDEFGHDVTVIDDRKAPYIAGPYRFHGYNKQLRELLDGFDIPNYVVSRHGRQRPRGINDYRIAFYTGDGTLIEWCEDRRLLDNDTEIHEHLYNRSRHAKFPARIRRADALGDPEAYSPTFASSIAFDLELFHSVMHEYLKPIDGVASSIDIESNKLEIISIETNESKVLKYDNVVFCTPRWEFPHGVIDYEPEKNVDYALYHVIAFRSQKMLSLMNDVIYPIDSEVVHRVTYRNGLWYAEFNAELALHDALVDLSELFGDYSIDSITSRPHAGCITESLPETVIWPSIHAIGRFATFDPSETLANSVLSARSLGEHLLSC